MGRVISCAALLSCLSLSACAQDALPLDAPAEADAAVEPDAPAGCVAMCRACALTACDTRCVHDDCIGSAPDCDAVRTCISGPARDGGTLSDAG